MENGEGSSSGAQSGTGVSITETVHGPIVPGNRRFDVNFYGFEIKTVVTCFPEVIEAWIRETEALMKPNSSRFRIVGLAVQWPDYKYFHHFVPVVSAPAEILTLCVGNRCLMVQLREACALPDNLRRFLADISNRFVGLNNFYDPEKLVDFSGHNLVLPLINIRNVGDFLFDIPSRKDLLSTKMEFLYEEYRSLSREIAEARRVGFYIRSLWLQQVQYCTVQAYLYYMLGIEFRVADYI